MASEYHVLFNEEGGPVREVNVATDSFEAAEAAFVRAHPKAEYWEIGIPPLKQSSEVRGVEGHASLKLNRCRCRTIRPK